MLWRPRCLQTLVESLVLSWMLRRQHAVLKRLHLCSFLQQSLASGAMKDSRYKSSCYKCKWGVGFLLLASPWECIRIVDDKTSSSPIAITITSAW